MDDPHSINRNKDLGHVSAQGRSQATGSVLFILFGIAPGGERQGMNWRQSSQVTVDLHGGFSDWGSNVCLAAPLAPKQTS